MNILLIAFNIFFFIGNIDILFLAALNKIGLLINPICFIINWSVAYASIAESQNLFRLVVSIY